MLGLISIFYHLWIEKWEIIVNMMPPVDRVYPLFCYLILSSFFVLTLKKKVTINYIIIFHKSLSAQSVSVLSLSRL